MRQIKKQMFDFIEAKLEKNGLAQEFIKTKNARGLFCEAAKACVGVVYEKTGRNDGPLVELIQMTVDGKAQREAWCMAFVQTMLDYVEEKLGIQSPLLSTEHCLTLFRDTKKNHPEQMVKRIPLPGAIAIWQHGNTSSGHTEIVIAADGDEFQAVGGNTREGKDAHGAVVRDGGGVHYTVRDFKGSGDMKLLGFIKPFVVSV